MQKLPLKSRLACARPSRCHGRASRCGASPQATHVRLVLHLVGTILVHVNAVVGSGRRRSRSLRPSRSQPFEGLSTVSTVSCGLAAAAARSVRPCLASGAPQPCQNSFIVYIHSMKCGGRRSNRRLSLYSGARNQRCTKTRSADQEKRPHILRFQKCKASIGCCFPAFP